MVIREGPVSRTIPWWWVATHLRLVLLPLLATTTIAVIAARSAGGLH
jgi:hypothetical protein